MKKITTVVAIAALSSQLAGPAFAADMSQGLFNSTTVLGLARTGDAAAMAYVHMPFGGHTTSAPRLGVMFVGPQSYLPGEAHLHLNGPRMADLSFSGRDFSAPWQTASWTSTLTLGKTVAWTNDKNSIPPGQGPALFDSGLSWVAVGVISAGVVIGAFALTNRPK